MKEIKFALFDNEELELNQDEMCEALGCEWVFDVTLDLTQSENVATLMNFAAEQGIDYAALEAMSVRLWESGKTLFALSDDANASFILLKFVDMDIKMFKANSDKLVKAQSDMKLFYSMRNALENLKRAKFNAYDVAKQIDAGVSWVQNACELTDEQYKFFGGLGGRVKDIEAELTAVLKPLQKSIVSVYTEGWGE